MKKKKMTETLKKLNTLVGRGEREQKVKLKQVKGILDALDEREQTIRKHLGDEKKKNKFEALTGELEVIQAQRQKGEQLLQEVKEKKKAKNGKNAGVDPSSEAPDERQNGSLEKHKEE